MSAANYPLTDMVRSIQALPETREYAEIKRAGHDRLVAGQNAFLAAHELLRITKMFK